MKYLMMIITLVTSANSICSMPSERSVHIINKHKEDIMIHLANLPNEYTQELKPDAVYKRSYQYDKEIMLKAVIMGPVIQNTLELPLKQDAQYQAILFSFDANKTKLRIVHDGETVKKFRPSENIK